jgi:hypothetical protein
MCRDFAVPAIIGAVATPVFYYMFRFIDNEEYEVKKQEHGTSNQADGKGSQQAA